MQPTIVFDIDGTLTDYKEFIKKRPFPYFEKKYAMKAVHPCELEPEDIFDI
jgi:FMN phosphatase YigB (HAD superfamily)